jgi:DNA-binding response OmpR family regulator
VILSADAIESQRKKLLSAGADGYMTKPFDIHELRRTVDSLQPTAAEPAISPLRSVA